MYEKLKKGATKGDDQYQKVRPSAVTNNCHILHMYGQRFSSWLHCEVYSKRVCSLSSFLDRRNDCTKFCLPCSWKSRQWQIPRFVCHDKTLNQQCMLVPCFIHWLTEWGLKISLQRSTKQKHCYNITVVVYKYSLAVQQKSEIPLQ